jgi:hypothetical protein
LRRRGKGGSLKGVLASVEEGFCRMLRSNDEMGIYDIKFSVKIINIYSHAGGQK